MVEVSPWPLNLVDCLFHALHMHIGGALFFGTLLNHGMSGAMVP